MEFWGQVSGQHVIFEGGSLAEMYRFWSSKLHFWRKSRTKASFLIFKASFLKEVSQKCFVFDLQSFIFEGRLAQKLRFWASKIHFWRRSRRKASFLIFKASFFEASFLSCTASFLKEVSQKSFIFELHSFVFEGSLAEKLRFWAAKLRFCRRPRRNVRFLKLRFWAAQLRFWRKSRRKASFLSCTASFLKEVARKKRFDFALQSFNFEGSLAESQLVSQPISQSINKSVSQSAASQLVS